MKKPTITADEIRALCEQYGYGVPGPNTVKTAQENGLTAHELAFRFELMARMEREGIFPTIKEAEDAYLKALKLLKRGTGDDSYSANIVGGPWT